MRKRLIALTLTLALLISVSPTVFADNTSARPTVEEILSDYHQAAFEAETSGEASASTYSRSGSSGQTLEQQTVDTLNEAGYEAYNVTADNYDTLEEQLQTDFSEMGLDRDGSYIIVIEGEEENSTNSNARLSDITLPPHLRDDGYGAADGTFTYTYNGTTYTMRQIVVTSTDDKNYSKAASIDLLEKYGDDFFSNFADTYITMCLDLIDERIPIGTFLSLMGLTTENSYVVRNGTLQFHAGATWHRMFTQVWSSYDEAWIYGSSVEYVETISYCNGLVLNMTTGNFEEITKDKYTTTRYSSDYYNSTQQKTDAVLGYLNGATRYDIVGDIDCYFGNNKVITLPENFF